jgi:predicted nucleotidyltransferase
MRPKQGRFGSVLANPYDVLDAIVKARSETIQVHGAVAVLNLGLSTQVPMRPIFMTSGASRVIRVNNTKIELRHAGRQKLLLADRPAGLAIAAMWYLGKREVTLGVVAKIRRALGTEEFKVVFSVIDSMPAWMRSVFVAHGPGAIRPSSALDLCRLAVRETVARYGAANPRVFGSVLHGTDTENSDLNLLLDQLPELSFYEVELLESELAGILGVKVRVSTPEDLPLAIKDSVLAAALRL